MNNRMTSFRVEPVDVPEAPEFPLTEEEKRCLVRLTRDWAAHVGFDACATVGDEAIISLFEAGLLKLVVTKNVLSVGYAPERKVQSMLDNKELRKMRGAAPALSDPANIEMIRLIDSHVACLDELARVTAERDEARKKYCLAVSSASLEACEPYSAEDVAKDEFGMEEAARLFPPAGEAAKKGRE